MDCNHYWVFVTTTIKKIDIENQKATYQTHEMCIRCGDQRTRELQDV